MGQKTELQRKILITALNNPNLNQSEIAQRMDCSSSYVSSVLSRFNSVDAMNAEVEQLNHDLGLNSQAGLGGGWGFDANPDWNNGGDFDADLDEAVREGVEGFKVLSKKTKGLIDKFRN